MTSVAFFCCLDCGCELTDLLQPMPDSRLVITAQVPAVASGRYVELDADWEYCAFVRRSLGVAALHDAREGLLIFRAGDILLNPADVRHRVAADARHGCCGYDPGNQLNALCPNGHPVGALHTECTLPTVFRLDRTRVAEVPL
jgi:hypothetical protein